MSSTCTVNLLSCSSPFDKTSESLIRDFLESFPAMVNLPPFDQRSTNCLVLSRPGFLSWIPACDMTVKWLLPAWWKNLDVLRRICDLFLEPLFELPRGPLRTGWSSISFLAKSIFDVRLRIKKNQTIPHMIAPESLFFGFYPNSGQSIPYSLYRIV